jgi:hypothetical protein
MYVCSRSQWPHDLRHELSSLAPTLGSWVRNPLRAWMFDVLMRLFCVCVFLCLGRGPAKGWSLVQGVLPSVVKWLRNWIIGLGPEWAGRAIVKTCMYVQSFLSQYAPVGASENNLCILLTRQKSHIWKYLLCLNLEAGTEYKSTGEHILEKRRSACYTSVFMCWCVRAHTLVHTYIGI